MTEIAIERKDSQRFDLEDLDRERLRRSDVARTFRSRSPRQRSVVNASRKDGRATAGVRGRTMPY